MFVDCSCFRIRWRARPPRPHLLPTYRFSNDKRTMTTLYRFLYWIPPLWPHHVVELLPPTHHNGEHKSTMVTHNHLMSYLEACRSCLIAPIAKRSFSVTRRRQTHGVRSVRSSSGRAINSIDDIGVGTCFFSFSFSVERLRVIPVLFSSSNQSEDSQPSYLGERHHRYTTTRLTRSHSTRNNHRLRACGHVLLFGGGPRSCMSFSLLSWNRTLNRSVASMCLPLLSRACNA